MKKICESCGMPMQKPDDFGGMDINNKYCVHCTDERGKLQSWEEKVKGTTHFFMRTSDVPEKKAKEMAIEYLKKFPAWKHIN